MIGVRPSASFVSRLSLLQLGWAKSLVIGVRLCLILIICNNNNCQKKPGEGDLVVAVASPVKWGSSHQARVVRRGCVDAWLHLETFLLCTGIGISVFEIHQQQV